MRARLARWLRSAAPVAGSPTGSPGRSAWLRRAGSLLAIAVIGASVYYLGRNLATGIGQLELTSLDFPLRPILVSIGTTVVCVAAGGWAWQLVLSSLGHPLPLDVCLGIQTASNLAKYLPGYAWQLLGKAYLTHRERVPKAVIACAMGLEMGCLCLTGLLVVLVFMPSYAALPLLGAVPYWARAGLAAGILLLLVLLPALLRAVGSKATTGWARRLALPRHSLPLWGAMGVMFAAWVLLGLAFGYLVQGFAPLTWADWPLSIYSLAISFLAGLMALFVPSGIGVRESVMAYTLGERVPGGVAVIIAVLSRLVCILGELIAFGLFWLWRAARNRHNPSIAQKD